MISKEDIYRKALLSLNISYDRIKDNSDSIELEYCREYLDSAVAYCSTIRPWYWLMKTEEYDDSDADIESYKGLEYSYVLPKDFVYPYLVDGVYNEDYSIAGDSIHFSHPISSLSYVSKTQFDGEGNQKWTYPEAYSVLIATRLAVEIAPFIAPDTAIEQRCMARLQLSVQTLNKLDIESTRRKNPDPKEFVE